MCIETEFCLHADVHTDLNLLHQNLNVFKLPSTFNLNIFPVPLQFTFTVARKCRKLPIWSHDITKKEGGNVTLPKLHKH